MFKIFINYYCSRIFEICSWLNIIRLCMVKGLMYGNNCIGMHSI